MEFKCCLSREKDAGLYSELAPLCKRACKKYHALSKYEEALPATLKGIMDGVHPGKDGTDESPSLSFKSLSCATTCILNANNNAAQEILAYKDDIWRHKQLRAIVEKYLNLSLETLEFLHDLQRRIGDFRDRLEMLRRSFQQPWSANATALALDHLRDCEGFTPEFHSSLNQVIIAHNSILSKLQESRNKSRKGIHMPRRLPNVMYTILVTVFVSAVVCSILAAVLHAPLVLAAIPKVAINVTSWPPLISWVENLRKSSEAGRVPKRSLQADVQIAERVDRSDFFVIHELRDIEISVKALMEQNESLVGNADPIIKTQDDVFIPSCKESDIDSLSSLIEGMVKLDEQVTRCGSHIKDTATQIQKKMKAGAEHKESCCVPYWCHM